MGDLRTVQRGSGGRWAVLLGLAFITALGLAVLILWASPGPSGGNPPGLPMPLPPEPTARQAYQAAQEAARAWQADARPSSMAAHWQWVRGKWLGQTVWVVHFYSPSSGRLAVFLVEVGRVRMLREALSPYPLPTFNEDRWRMDSSEAMRSWWASGGDDFLTRHDNVRVTVQLKPISSTDGLPIWTITASAGAQLSSTTLNAVNGQVLP